jgi:hypothetical protein
MGGKSMANALPMRPAAASAARRVSLKKENPRRSRVAGFEQH